MLRNREIRRFAALFAAITVIAAVAGFAIGWKSGILMLIAAAVYGGAFFVFTAIRYRRLARLAEEIDRVLHEEEHICIDEFEEGELSILQSEITKMTSRIWEQNRALKKEKAHLAESLADIAHQLRTPLTSANLILSLLQKNPQEKERRALLRENEELFAQMDWLVNALIKLSRLDAGIVVFEKKPVVLEELIHAAVHPLLIALELHDISLALDVPEGAVLCGDFGWLSEVILNLVKNCMESVGDHGKIEIYCEDNLLFTQVSIHDSGTGFEKEELFHLFDRFYRGKNEAAAGYGIGLALCKSIITRQGGTIAAKNHREGGAVFSIRFPK